MGQICECSKKERALEDGRDLQPVRNMQKYKNSTASDDTKDTSRPQSMENPNGVSLVDFLEYRYQRSHHEEAFYTKWSKGIDYENWYIQSLIGVGGYAKVYKVLHLGPNGEKKFYAMKSIRKSKVLKSNTA